MQNNAEAIQKRLDKERKKLDAMIEDARANHAALSENFEILNQSAVVDWLVNELYAANQIKPSRFSP